MLKKTRLYAESWNVAWRKKTTGTILQDTATQFNIIENDLKYWAADPFVFEYQEEIYIFAELYDYSKCRGGLGYCKWDGKKFGKWKKVISEQYHLSYPYIFERNGCVYIMPESNANHSLHLYRAVEFPDTWEKSDVLRENVVYGDTTPFVWNGRSYALTYDVHDTKDYKLVLLDFKENQNDCMLDNLKIMELRRPAGKVFELGEEHVRPAQNCMNTYGEGLVFYKYEIDEQGYKESLIKEISPKDLKFSRKILLNGMHTYNSTNDFEVIDIKTRRFNLLNLIFRFLGKIKR